MNTVTSIEGRGTKHAIDVKKSDFPCHSSLVTRHCSRREQGFTLLEMLVATAIFMLLSIAAYSGLDSVQKTHSTINTEMDRLNEIQRTVMFLGRDLRQANGRGIRDGYGDAQAPLRGYGRDAGLGSLSIELSRAGYPNPMEIKRSHIQRVAYLIRNDILYRVTWPVLDRAPDTKPYIVKLCENITKLNFRYLDKDNEWQSEWPPAVSSNNTANAERLPRAIELSMELNDWGTITRLYPVAGKG